MDPQLLVLGLIVVAILAGLFLSFLRQHDEFGVRVHQWKDIAGVPSDQVFSKSSRGAKVDALADLYPAADAQTREQIRQVFDRSDQLEQLHRLISRAASSIKTADDATWLFRGLAIAAIEDGRFDRQDTMKRLVYLRQAAERVGIDARSHFDRMGDKLSPGLATVFNTVVSYSADDMMAITRESEQSVKHSTRGYWSS